MTGSRIRRAGLISDSAYAALLADIVNDVVLAPGRRFFSPMEMSLQAPFADAATAIDPVNQPNTFLSYYTWGAGIALGLDLALRARPGGKSLDGYMRLMWERFGRPARRYVVRRPYTVDDLERTLGEYAGDRAFAARLLRPVRAGTRGTGLRRAPGARRVGSAAPGAGQGIRRSHDARGG